MDDNVRAQPPEEIVYLVRCWQEGATDPGRRPAWRFSIQEIGTKHRRTGFSQLEHLFAFLKTQLISSLE